MSPRPALALIGLLVVAAPLAAERLAPLPELNRPGFFGDYISQQLCNGIEVSAVNACWVVPAGVAQSCCWGTECN